MSKDFEQMYSEGDVKEILSHLETQVQHEKELIYGPLPKNQATMDFEQIIQDLLDPQKEKHIAFSYAEGAYFVTIGQKKYNLSDILKNMDAKHLKFNKATQDQYTDLHNKKLIWPTSSRDEAYFRERDTKHQHDDLSYAEMAAINIYSGQFAYVMNGLMRNQNPDLLAQHDSGFPFQNPHTTAFQQVMKSTLLHIAMASSGLNKIPDKVIEAAFRGVEYSDQQRAERLDAVASPDAVLMETSFVSTSLDGIYVKKTDQIMFRNVIGKDIQALSDNPSEREFLIPPTQVNWISHVSRGGKHYYVAEPVYTLSGLQPKQAEMGVPLRVVDELLAKVKDIKTLYAAQPGTARTSGKRNKQIAELIETATRLLNDHDLPNNVKYEQMRELLLRTKQAIRQEKGREYLFSFGLRKKNESRLEKAIDSILNIQPEKPKADDKKDQKKGVYKRQ